MAGDNVPIKGIEYEIKGSSDKSVTGLKKLRDSLTALKSVTKGGLGLTDISKEINTFSKGIERLSQNGKIKAFGDSIKEISKIKVGSSLSNSLTKLSTAINGIDVSKLNAVTNMFKNMGGGADFSVKGLSSFSKFIETVDGKSNAIWEVSEYLNTISQMDFSNLAEAARNIRDIGRSARSFGRSGSGQSTPATETGAEDFGEQESESTTEGAEETARKVLNLRELFGQLISAERMTTETSKTLAYALDSLRVGFIGLLGVVGSAIKKIAQFAFSIGKTVVKTIGNVLKSIAQVPGKIKDSITNAVENLKEKIADVGAKAKEWFNNSIFTKPLRDAAAGAGEFAKKLANVGNSLKRILFYRVIRTVIKEIGDAFKTGINNLYAWSAAIGGEFAASMDRMATSMQYFKNSIGAAVAPLINALAPALDFVIDKVVSLLNVINQLFARLTGASYWTKATKQAASYGDAASSAGSAAKEAMKYIAPFDEMNILPDDSDSGSGGGGGAGGGTGGMFEELVEFNEEIRDFADRLREAFRAGDWEGVGDVISEKLNDIIENRIPWKSLGQKFGYWVNAIVQMEYWTLEKTHFDNLGKGVAEFVNNALEQIDFNTWGRVITRKLTAAFDFAIGFLTNLDTRRVGVSVHDFFVGMFDEWTEWFRKYDWSNLGHVMYQKLKDLFSGLDFKDIAEHFFTMLGTALGSAAQFLGTFFGDLGRDVKVWFDASLKGQNWNETAHNILTWIGDGFKNIGAWVDTNFITPFMNALGAGGTWSELKSVGAAIIEKIKIEYPTVVSWADRNVISPIKTALRTGEWGGVFSGENGVLNSLKEGYSTIRSWVITNVINPIGKVLFGDNWKDVNPNGESLINKLTSFLGNVGDWAKENIIAPIVNELESYNWTGLFESIFSGVEEAIRKSHPNWGNLLFGSEKKESALESGKTTAEVYAERSGSATSWSDFWKKLFGVKTAYALDADSAASIGIGSSIPVTLEATNIEDKVPKKQRVLSGFSANTKKAIDNIPDQEKVYDSTANFNNQNTKGNAFLRNPIWNALAYFNNQNTTGSSFLRNPIWNALANFSSQNTTGSTFLKNPIWDALANFNNQNTTGSAFLKNPVWEALAKFVDQNTTGSSFLKNPVWNASANFNNQNTTGSTFLKNPVWNALANFNNQNTTGSSFLRNPIWNALANFNNQNTAGSSFLRSPFWNALANFNNQNTTGSSFLRSPWWYAKAYFSSHGFASSWGIPWAYIKGWFNSHGFASSWSPWSYLTGCFKWWDFASSWNPWSYIKGLITGKASGGVFANGRWSPIEQFAGGGFPGGQLFVAREAGPELVGTLRGHTAVMNNDQIVASVSAGVARAISNIQFHMTGFGTASVPTYEQDDDTEELLYRAVMRALRDSDFDINVESRVDLDGRVVGESAVNYIRSQARQGSYPLSGMA